MTDENIGSWLRSHPDQQTKTAISMNIKYEMNYHWIYITEKMHFSINKRPTGLNGHLSIIAHTGSLIFAFLKSQYRVFYSHVNIFLYMHMIPIHIHKKIIISIWQDCSRILNENHIATLMSSELDLWPFDLKFNKEHLRLMNSIYRYVWYRDSR